MSTGSRRSRGTIWRGLRSARQASVERSTSMATSWSARHPAAGRPTAPVLWMRSPGWLGMISGRAVRKPDEADMLKFPRTIRLDPSDTFVFERAAEPGEWAVSGAFVFWNRDPATLGQKQRVALRSGFLGIDSLGWSTLAIVTEATEAERLAMIERLAGQLMEKFGAPDADAARLAAEEEVVFAASLCEHAPQTLLAVQRSVENGEIRERFRTLKPRQAAADADRLHAHASAFTFHEVEGDVELTEEVDLLGLIKTDRVTTDRT